jgi:membrane protein
VGDDAPAGPAAGDRDGASARPSAAGQTTPPRGVAKARRAGRGAGASFGDFARRVYQKADQDQIFFMAGAIAFNVLVAIIPLVLGALGVAGLILRFRYVADPAEPVLQYMLQALPPVSPEFVDQIGDALRGIIEQATGILGVSTLILIWVSTRLVGTLRTALREIFDIRQDRSIVAGKIFDIKMVIAAGTLLAFNVAITVFVDLLGRQGAAFLGMDPVWAEWVTGAYARLAAFLSIWFMFLLIYRYLPFRRIQWSTALIAATFTSAFFELLKGAFTWYMTSVANYTSTYQNLATLIILFLWVYYMAIIFILGGEVAQVAALQRVRRQQKERLAE